MTSEAHKIYMQKYYQANKDKFLAYNQKFRERRRRGGPSVDVSGRPVGPHAAIRRTQALMEFLETYPDKGVRDYRFWADLAPREISIAIGWAPWPDNWDKIIT